MRKYTPHNGDLESISVSSHLDKHPRHCCLMGNFRGDSTKRILFRIEEGEKDIDADIFSEMVNQMAMELSRLYGKMYLKREVIEEKIKELSHGK